MKSLGNQESDVICDVLMNGTPPQTQTLAYAFKQISPTQKTKKSKKNNYQTFLDSDSTNGILYAPTQVGKSMGAYNIIRKCLEMNTPVIVSTDNKLDQCEQLMERIKANLIDTNIPIITVSGSKFSKNFEKCINNNPNRFIIFCLNNASQIKKLSDAMKLATFSPAGKKLRKIAIIHDEADTITKDKNINAVCTGQAESHKKWIELVELFGDYMMLSVKRFFITATPENVCMLYNVENADVLTVDIPENYVGYKDIQYTSFEELMELNDIISHEVARINNAKTNEVILYCVERNVASGHQQVMLNIARSIKCSVNTYNGTGITCIFNTPEKSEAFKQLLIKRKIKYSIDDTPENRPVITTKELPIRRFYSMCKKIGENCIITIGKDLITRGISYVGEDERDPLTATTMIYKPGTSMHAVGICQTIGRITGCAMPNLQRRLYAPDSVIKAYNCYCENQESYINQIKSGEKTLNTKDIISNMLFADIGRNIDRPKLGLKMNYASSSESNTAYESDYYDSDKMKRLVGSWAKTTNNAKVAQLFRDMIANGGIMEHANVKSYFETPGPYDALTNSNKVGHRLVFTRDSKNHTIKPEAMAYYSSKF